MPAGRFPDVLGGAGADLTEMRLSGKV